MQIRLYHFAIVREIIGNREEVLEIESGNTVNDLFAHLAEAHPSLGRLRPSLMFMVNEHYVQPEHELSDGDEVAFIPPVAGGAQLISCTEEPIDLNALVAAVSYSGAGAITTFSGTVRDNARGRSVVRLEYEAYPAAADRMMEQIATEIQERWGLDHVGIIHRFGTLAVGDTSVAIAVAGPHRSEAFEACRYAIDRIKEIVPIWKKEFYADSETWVGSEADYQATFGHSTRSS